MSEWDPSGAVLVVGHSVKPEVIVDVRRRCADTSVHVLDLDEALDGEDEPDADADAEPAGEGLDYGFSADSDRAAALVAAVLAEHDDITTILAQSRWAARDVWRIVRVEPRLRAFTHLDNLDRARGQRLDIDVSPQGRRRNSHRFALEFAGDEPSWDPRARVRVLVGPGNAHGRAAGWARALRTLKRVDALSLAVGDDGFPAELMATSADWEAKAVRRQALELAATATHLLVDDTGPVAEELRGAGGARVVVAAGRDLPVAVVPGDLPDRAATPMQVVVVAGDEPEVPGTWRTTVLDDLPPSLWVAAVRHADLVVDQRDPPVLDALTLNGMANGAVIVADLPGRGAFRKPPPQLRSVTDPLQVGEPGMRQLRADSAAYVVRRHSDAAVARTLRRVLRVR